MSGCGLANRYWYRNAELRAERVVPVQRRVTKSIYDGVRVCTAEMEFVMNDRSGVSEEAEVDFVISVLDISWSA